MGFVTTGLPVKIEESRGRHFETLTMQHWDRFYAYAYRHCENAADAEDLLAESLLEAYQAFDAYQGHGFDRWVFRILTTNRIDQARRAKRRPVQAVFHLLETVAGAGNPAQRVLDPLLSEEFQLALAKLPEGFRLPLLLCDLEGLSYSAIAERLDVPLGTVRSRIHRARERLHLELSQFCHLKDCPICGKATMRRVPGLRR